MTVTMNLPPEVLIKIIKEVRRPLPRPDGKANRADLRQGDLATLMRVSKEHNNLASSILYRTVATDDIPRLVYNVRSPAAANGINSKARNLASNRHLFLEYKSKLRPTYWDILQDGGAYWMTVDSKADVPSAKQCKAICLEEMQGAIAGFLDLAEMNDDLKDLIEEKSMVTSGPTASNSTPDKVEKPNTENQALEPLGLGIKTVGICSFLGGQDEVWSDNWNASIFLVRRTREALMAVLEPLAARQNLESLCQRDFCGPYRMPELGCLQNVAFHMKTIYPPTCIWPCVWSDPKTNRTTWYIESKYVKPLNPATIIDHPAFVSDGLSNMGRRIERQMNTLRNLGLNIYVHDFDNAADRRSDFVLDNDFLMGLLLRGHKSPERRFVEGLELAIGMGHSHTPNDKWILRGMQDAPRCAACGWSSDLV